MSTTQRDGVDYSKGWQGAPLVSCSAKAPRPKPQLRWRRVAPGAGSNGEHRLHEARRVVTGIGMGLGARIRIRGTTPKGQGALVRSGGFGAVVDLVGGSLVSPSPKICASSSTNQKLIDMKILWKPSQASQIVGKMRKSLKPSRN